MHTIEAAILDLNEVASSPAPITERARGLLERLHRLVPFDSAWLAHIDPLLNSYDTVSTRDLDPRIRDCLAGPAGAHDVDAAGVNRPRSLVTVSDLPFPAQELETWSDYLIPAGYSEALAVALYSSHGHHVGFLALLLEDGRPPAQQTRRLMQKLTPLLADSIDPTRSLLPAARLVRGAEAGVVLRADGATQQLPGLNDHALLRPHSAVLRLAQHTLSANRLHATFLWPIGGDHAPHGHLQITVLSATADAPDIVVGMVLVSPPPELHGLTPRELQILGLLIDGQSNAGIAYTLTVASRTVAAHVEHILHKLGAASRTSAAVRAERGGLYVPAIPRASRPSERS
jgi:DNA-binding CsgD family transcriptional regulator